MLNISIYKIKIKLINIKISLNLILNGNISILIEKICAAWSSYIKYFNNKCLCFTDFERNKIACKYIINGNQGSFDSKSHLKWQCFWNLKGIFPINWKVTAWAFRYVALGDIWPIISSSTFALFEWDDVKIIGIWSLISQFIYASISTASI